jgi:hypothetical protein
MMPRLPGEDAADDGVDRLAGQDAADHVDAENAP